MSDYKPLSPAGVRFKLFGAKENLSDDKVGIWMHEVISGMRERHRSQLKSKEQVPDVPALTDALVFRIRDTLHEKFDCKLKAAPSGTELFLLIARDGKTLAAIHRDHPRWPMRTLKDRKKKLGLFLYDNFHGLTLDLFRTADRSIFRGSDKMISDHRAARVRPRAVAEFEDETEEEG